MTELDNYVSDDIFMFYEQDAKRARENYEKALEISMITDRLKRRKVKRDEANKRTIAILLSALIALGIVSIKTSKVNSNDVITKSSEITIDKNDEGLIDSISNYFSTNSEDSKYSMENMSKLIGSIVFEKTMDFNPKYDTTEISILSQSTIILGENKIAYDHDKVARLLLEAERKAQAEGFSLMEYALCGVRNSMGKYASVKPISDLDKTNMDLVIESIVLMDKDKITKELFGKAKTEEELIEGLGYKDYASWKEEVNKLDKAEVLYEHLLALRETLEESKGAKL